MSRIIGSAQRQLPERIKALICDELLVAIAAVGEMPFPEAKVISDSLLRLAERIAREEKP